MKLAYIGIFGVLSLILSLFIVERKYKSFVNEKKNWIIAGIFCFFAAVTVFSVWHHEYWRDEVQAWCLVRDLSVREIFAQLKIEGHPALWFLVILPFAKIGLPIEALSVLTLGIILTAAYILLKKAPFEYWLKTLILFSSVMLYYNSVIARVYALIILIVFCIAACYENRFKKPFWYCFFIFLLSQTHVVMAGLVIMLWLMYMEELFEKKKSVKYWANSIQIPLGLILVILELMGNGRTSAEGIFGRIFFDIKGSIQEFFRQLQFSIELAAGVEISTGIFYLLFVIIVLCGICFFKGYWREILIIAGGIGAQIFIAAFIYATIRQRAILVFLTIVFGYWICLQRKKELNGASDNTNGMAVWMQRYMVSLLVIVGCISFYTTYLGMVDDYRRSYSGAKEIAEYVEENLPKNAVIVSNVSVNITGISGCCASIRLWDPATDTFFSYVDWGKKGFDTCEAYEDIRDRIIRKFKTTEGIYFLMNRMRIPGDMKYEELELLVEQEPSIIEDEYFSLYKFK
ncbi:MAG: hypothetical protein J6A75_07560 [Lachnospiraceae bacterium]|nr:hypothetical protein [Lachnospiraceae bacterium]